MVPVEAVARGYLAGSGLIDYAATGAVCGNPLPAGLRDGDQLPEPIFTPATKAAMGEHDENVSYAAIVATVGEQTAQRAARTHARRLRPRRRDRREARHHPGRHEVRVRPRCRRHPGARRRGAHPGLVTVLAGRPVGAGTRAAQLRQAVRPRLVAAHRRPVGTAAQAPLRRRCPADVVEQTRARYVEAYERLTGLAFADWLSD